MFSQTARRHGGQRLLSPRCPQWTHIYQHASSNRHVPLALIAPIMTLYVIAANSVMKKSLRSGEGDLLRCSSNVHCHLISRTVAGLAPHLEMWNSLKERAKSWLLTVHPALLPTRSTVLIRLLQQVLQVLRSESCTF